MSAPYSSKAVANAFLAKGVSDGIAIDPMKIQKLVYMAHGYYMSANKSHTPLINELFEAWKFGPVLPSLYHEFREFGGQPITRSAMEHREDVGFRVRLPAPKGDQLFDSVMDYVWKTYGPRSGSNLSNLTHREDGPWDRTRRAKPGIINADIDNELIRQHFDRLVTVRNAGNRATVAA